MGDQQSGARNPPFRIVPPEELERRIAVYDQQQEEGFTNAEAAKLAGMSLSNWVQFKSRQRKKAAAAEASGRDSRADAAPSSEQSLRGRKVPAWEIEQRIATYEAQERDGFTNAEAAARLGMGMPAWNQWKQKYRKNGGVMSSQADPSSTAPTVSENSARPPLPGNTTVEIVRLRARVAELETILDALRDVLAQPVTESTRRLACLLLEVRDRRGE